MIFFFYFFRNFLAHVGCERNSRLKFFSLFLGLSYPVLSKNNAGKGFFNFLNFFGTFFGIFLPWSCVNGIRNKFFFFLFLGLSHPVLSKNNAGNGFFNCFFYFFSEFSCPGRVWTEFGTKIFFLSFSASLSPFWIEIMLDRGFLIFLFFLLFFSEYSCPGRVWTEFGTKIFFSLSRAISSRFGWK